MEFSTDREPPCVSPALDNKNKIDIRGKVELTTAELAHTEHIKMLQFAINIERTP